MKVLKNVKNFAGGLSDKAKKAFCTATLASTCAIMNVVPALAAEDGLQSGSASTISSALQSGLSSMVSDFMALAALIIPIGLGVFGVVFGIRKGKQFFKIITN